MDLSLPEVAVIAIVALLVLGPERLPGAARTAGALVRRAQRSWSGIRADIERELAADELKRQLRETREAAGIDTIRNDLEQARADIGRGLEQTRTDVGRGLDPRPELGADAASAGADPVTHGACTPTAPAPHSPPVIGTAAATRTGTGTPATTMSLPGADPSLNGTIAGPDADDAASPESGPNATHKSDPDGRS